MKDAFNNPAYIQRCAMLSEKDMNLAYLVGREVARALIEEDYGKSVIVANEGDEDENRLISFREPIKNIDGKTRFVSDIHYFGINGPSQQFFSDFSFLVKDEIKKYPEPLF